jgi:hypothetical protein
MGHMVDTLADKVDALRHALKVQCLKLGDVLDSKFVALYKLFHRDLLLIETANNTDTLA